MKIYLVGAGLLQVDGRTHKRTHDEANSRSSQFCERAWKGQNHTWFTSYMITFLRFEVLPVATVMFTLKMEAADHYAAFVISTIL